MIVVNRSYVRRIADVPLHSARTADELSR